MLSVGGGRGGKGLPHLVGCKHEGKRPQQGPWEARSSRRLCMHAERVTSQILTQRENEFPYFPKMRTNKNCYYIECYA
jgi:hypothetical protein